MSIRKIWNAEITGRTPRQVVKTGHVLTLKEEAAAGSPGGSSSLLTGTSIPNVHYQIFCAPGACDICAAHNGEIHPVVMGQAGVDLPPFHPNCKCTVKGYEISQSPYDPAARERELWTGLMISRLNLEQQASMLMGFYRWEDIDPQDVIAALTAVSELEDVGMRIEGFFEEMGIKQETVMTPAVTVNNWLNLFSKPTAPGVGRKVEMPIVDGWNPTNWYAFEGNTFINKWARVQMDIEGILYETHIGDSGELIDAEGRYWIAVGPNVMNPDHDPEEEIDLADMYTGAKLDIVLMHDDGTVYYLPAVVGDTKQHTYPNGILQTGLAIPGGEGTPMEPGAPVEFIGAELPKYLIDYKILHIIVYDR